MAWNDDWVGYVETTHYYCQSCLQLLPEDYQQELDAQLGNRRELPHGETSAEGDQHLRPQRWDALVVDVAVQKQAEVLRRLEDAADLHRQARALQKY